MAPSSIAGEFQPQKLSDAYSTHVIPGSQYSVADVVSWLQHVGMSEYCQAFRTNHIDGAALLALTTEELKELGVTVSPACISLLRRE
jgi:hypothetical protein